MNLEEAIISAIGQIEAAYDASYDPKRVIDISERTFSFVLAALPATRRMPGINQHMGFYQMYKCQSEEDKQLVKDELKKVFNITDQKSMLEICNRNFSCGRDYETFKSIWDNNPSFNPESLNPQVKEVIKKTMAFAQNLIPYVDYLYAFDYSERTMVLRYCYACDYINEYEYSQYAFEMVNAALKYYNNYKEYATALVLGGAYFLYKTTLKEEDAIRYLNTLTKMAIHIIAEDRVFVDASWGYKKVA